MSRWKSNDSNKDSNIEQESKISPYLSGWNGKVILEKPNFISGKTGQPKTVSQGTKSQIIIDEQQLMPNSKSQKAPTAQEISLLLNPI